jgi:hypothetical protein
MMLHYYYSQKKPLALEDFVGKVMKSVTNKNNEELEFITNDDRKFAFFHEQDCCESVTIEEIWGELDNLVGSPILVAVEVSANDLQAEESGTWTFYKFATVKGWVDVRWYGSSNGYYSESVGYFEIVPKVE